MTQEMTPDRSANELEVTIDDESLAADIAGVASMVSDAYDAPPVPKSLVKRLDAGIAKQWGESPDLIPSRVERATELTRKGISRVRAWPLAAGLAATLMLAIFLAGGTGNDAWAAVVDAMKKQGLIQIDDAQGVRWLDLSNCVVGCQTSEKTKWMDLRQRVVLTRENQSNTLLQDSLAFHGDASQSGPLLAAFLSGQPLSVETLDRFQNVEVVEQQRDRVTINGRDWMDLRVRFRTASEDFLLSLHVDPETNLPVSVDASVNKAGGQPVSLAYLQQSAKDLQTQHFPSELTIVQANVDSADRVAALDRSPDSLAPVKDVITDRSVDGSDHPDRHGIHPSGDKNPSGDQIATVGALPIGSANKWAPVVVVRRSDDEVVQQIDRLLTELWQKEGIHSVEAASDLQLLRRAYLDLTGRSPTVTEVRQYMNDKGSDRYERLVDQLLASPDHASQLAAVWRSFLIPEGVDLDAFGGREAFEKWMAERFAANEPYDQIVRKLLLAEGRLSQSGPLLFYSALKLDADQLAARTSRAFLGMRLECAQCHDHPFESWTQEDFWSYAAFFAQISRPQGELENVSTVMRVRDIDRGEVMLPESDTVVPPRFLGSFQRQSAGDEKATARREKLASWLTGPDNPYFARATVNRLWSQFFGRGIVDPVDDFGMNNEAVSPQLLDALASQFIDSDFDVKKLIRSIVLSRAYRLSSSSSNQAESNEDAAVRLENFAQMNVKTLTAEQLYDCIAVATLLDNKSATTNDYTLSRFGNSSREQFLQQFAAPAANRSEYLAGIPQALMLMNGSLTSGATGEQSSGLIRSLEAPFFTDRQRLDVLFMATLSRPATAQEASLFEEFVPADASGDQRTEGLADLLWALVNSAEFTLNH